MCDQNTNCIAWQTALSDGECSSKYSYGAPLAHTFYLGQLAAALQLTLVIHSTVTTLHPAASSLRNVQSRKLTRDQSRPGTVPAKGTV